MASSLQCQDLTQIWKTTEVQRQSSAIPSPTHSSPTSSSRILPLQSPTARTFCMGLRRDDQLKTLCSEVFLVTLFDAALIIEFVFFSVFGYYYFFKCRQIGQLSVRQGLRISPYVLSPFPLPPCLLQVGSQLPTSITLPTISPPAVVGDQGTERVRQEHQTASHCAAPWVKRGSLQILQIFLCSKECIN